MRLTFPHINGTVDIYMDVMRAICGDTTGKSMVDLGCCYAPHTPLLGFKERLYIDAIERKLDHPDEQKYFVQANILDILYAPISHQFDVAIASDVIEHLLHNDGHQLLRLMQRIARKRIIFTRTTDLFGMAEDDNHDPEAHRSLWTPDEFEKEGWNVIVFPNYHQVWNGGAFFSWSEMGSRPIDELARVQHALEHKPWAI